MSEAFSMCEIFEKPCGRRWHWSICTAQGPLVMTGSGRSRSAVSYEANRALCLLLLGTTISRVSLS